ncbi:MAG: hypothetical protein IJI37_04245, partial [Opitutales bacterium]|nr:hypothetical protein [Opitutales bacterium]
APAPPQGISKKILLRPRRIGAKIFPMAAKTNVARILESVGAKFDFHTYECGGAISGVEVARTSGACSRRS